MLNTAQNTVAEHSIYQLCATPLILKERMSKIEKICLVQSQKKSIVTIFFGNCVLFGVLLALITTRAST